MKALGGSGEKLPMGETVPSFSSLIFPEFLMPRTSGNESLIFPTRKQWPDFSWKQQTGVFFDSCERTPNLAVFAREVLILIFVLVALFWLRAACV